MTMLTSKNLVAFALVAIASLAFLSVGCSREEGAREASGEAAGDGSAATRIDDPEYVARLNETVDARRKLVATRARLEAQMAAEGADRESLQARIDDLNKAIEDERKHAVEIVRERLLSDGSKEPVEQ